MLSGFLTTYLLLAKKGRYSITYLGKISYGYYMPHGSVIVASFRLVKGLVADDSSLLHQGAVYGLALAGSVVLAKLSYRYPEAPFLKYKKLLVRVKSEGQV